MLFFKKIFIKLKDFFCIPQAPVGLSAMGVKSKYLEKINVFNYSKCRFYSSLLNPVKDPYFMKYQNK